MTRFQGAVRTSNVTNANAACELIAGPSGCRVFGVRITLASAVATVLGLGRPAVKGVTPTTPASLPSCEGRPEASQTQTALAWGTSPTSPATFMERVSTTAAIGFIRDWKFDAGIWIPAGFTLVLFNITGGGTLDLSWDISE